MNEQHKYRSTDKMSDLICDNYSLLMVMSRFGLSLGFGAVSYTHLTAGWTKWWKRV